MSSREDILQNIRRATYMKYEKPDLKPLEDVALSYPDRLEQFSLVMKQVGGEAVLLAKREDVNDFISRNYPEARRVASNLEFVTCATCNPDRVVDPSELDDTDLAVIAGKIGVAENGAVWIEQDVKQRAIYFIAEKLLILLDRNHIVNNMHEAYKLIDTGKYGFGTFISGPSKTADIEQALVMGVHGSRSVVVALI